MGMVLSVPFALLLAAPQGRAGAGGARGHRPRPGTGRGPGADPPMGWNSWNRFPVRRLEQLIRETDGRRHGRHRAEGCRLPVHQHRRLLARRGATRAVSSSKVDAKRFPNGMKALADYIHSKGLQDRHLLPTPAGRPAAAAGSRATNSRTRRPMPSGHRLPEVRLVQHRGPERRGRLPTMSAALRCEPVGPSSSAFASGQQEAPGSGARKVSHCGAPRRHHRLLPTASSTTATGRPGAWCRSSTCRRACANTPARATGTTRHAGGQ